MEIYRPVIGSQWVDFFLLVYLSRKEKRADHISLDRANLQNIISINNSTIFFHHNTEKIIDGIEKVDYKSPRGHIKMDPNHLAYVPIYLFLVEKKDGKFVLKTAASVGNFGTPYSGPDAPGGECKMSK